MGTQEHRSEIARFLAQWDEEVEAMLLGLNGIATTARHDFIARRIQAFGNKHLHHLEALVAKQEAIKLVTEPLNIVESEEPVP